MVGQRLECSVVAGSILDRVPTESAKKTAAKWLKKLSKSGVYAAPRPAPSVDDCYFYHTMDIPGHGLVEGQWDLRDGIPDYLGHVEFAGKRVLEIGTASGFLCFAMERMGAEVVAFDISEKQSWDLVPVASVDLPQIASERKAIMRKINNGYWFNHHAHASRARAVYGTVYDIPEGIGTVDIATYCSVLLHLRDPFLALQNGLRLTRSTAIVTDLVNPRRGSPPGAPPTVEFVPEFRNDGPTDTWWFLTPEIVVEMLGVLGFGDSTVTRHQQKAHWGDADLFTVVAHRTRGEPVTG